MDLRMIRCLRWKSLVEGKSRNWSGRSKIETGSRKNAVIGGLDSYAKEVRLGFKSLLTRPRLF